MLAVVAYGTAVAFAVPRTSDPPTTYAATSELASLLDLTAGLGLACAGLALWSVRGNGSLGPLTTAAAVAWLAPNWVGWEDGPALGRSLAMVAVVYLPVLILHIVWSAPAGRVRGRAARRALGAAYAATTAVALGRAALRDPFEDPYCWSNCTDNVLLIAADRGLARGLDEGWVLLALVVAAATLIVGVGSLLRAASLRRAALLPVAIPAVALAAGEAAYAIALMPERVEDPEQLKGVFLWRAVAATVLAMGLCRLLERRLRTRSIVARLAGDLRAAPAPGTLRDSLAAALGDPTLEVAYWLAGEERFVDASGAVVRPPPGRATTPILRDGRLVAALWHDPSVGGADVEQEIGAAARLAIENERLRAELLVRLAELTALRERIIEAGDEERRRLERDLHDGAQQRLLALSYDLRLAATEAPSLAAAVAEAQAALADLRELASGIHPAILTDAGLGPALESLADTAPVAVEIEEVPAARYSAPVETTVYLLVAEQVDGRETGAPTVRIVAREGAVEVEVHDAQAVPAHLADRVAALGGRLELTDHTLRVRLPVSSTVDETDDAVA